MPQSSHGRTAGCLDRAHGVRGERIERGADFWRELGIRNIERNENVAILKLHGGTHLILVPGTPPRAPMRRST